MAEKGRKPDFNLSAMNMDTMRKGRVGAAWKNEDGTISISLDPFIILQGDGHTHTKVQLMLFPNDGDEGYKRRQREAEQRRAADKGTKGIPEDIEDDIPF